MRFTVNARIVAENIISRLKEGIRLNRESLHFIDSTFGVSDAESIREILADPDGGGEILFRFILYPDRCRQMQLEPVLAKYRPGAEEIFDIIERVKQEIQSLAVHLPDNAGSFSVRVPAFGLDHFISHLNLSNHLDAALAAAVDRYVPEEKQPGIRVALRNSRIDFSEKNIIWLKALFSAYPLLDDVFEPAITFSLGFLEDVGADQDIYTGLAKLKKRLFAALEKNRAFMERLQKSNMETLILQGIRSTAVNPEAVKSTMAIIDRICFAVFGMTEHLETVTVRKDPGEISAGSIREIADVFKDNL